MVRLTAAISAPTMRHMSTNRHTLGLSARVSPDTKAIAARIATEHDLTTSEAVTAALLGWERLSAKQRATVATEARQGRSPYTPGRAGTTDSARTRMIAVLRERGPIELAALTEACGSPKSTVSEYLSRLSRDGQAERTDAGWRWCE